MKSQALFIAGALAQSEMGCSIDKNVLEPRPFHRGFTFVGCSNQADENDTVPSRTTCKKAFCNQFRFSQVENVECVDGQWSALPNCFKGCPAPTSKAGYQFVGCRKNLGEGTSKEKGWYEDESGSVFYPPQQRCRKVQCPSATREFLKTLAKEDRTTVAAKANIGERFECNCDVDGNCFWLNFNDQTHGDDLNEEIELSCASWSEWNNEGECTKKKRTLVRRCVQPNGDEATEGVDCVGEATQVVSCGRQNNF